MEKAVIDCDEEKEKSREKCGSPNVEKQDQLLSISVRMGSPGATRTKRLLSS